MLSSSSSSSNPKPNPNFQMHKSGNPMNMMKTCCSSTPPPGFRVSNPHTFPRAMTLSSLANPNPVLVQAQVHSASAVEESGSSPLDPSVPLVVVSFYKFADFPDHSLFRKPLKDLCQQMDRCRGFRSIGDGCHIHQADLLQRVSGGIILAPEGINGSICGTRESVKRVLQFIQNDDRLKGLRQVESPVSPEEEAIHHGHSSSSPLAAGEDAPFRWDHVRVKLKKEIVSLGMPDVSPAERVGTYVRPKDWNALIIDPDTFKGAVDPCTTAFREFPSWVDNQFQGEKPVGGHSKPGLDSLDENLQQDLGSQTNMPSKVAMYCTGGIRCEKASSFLLSKGFKEVYHLEGGILKYLEEVPKTESLWEGECFVFDKRVSVEHGLAQGTFKLCYGCKQPVSDADMQAAEYEYGVSCPYCYSLKSDEEKERARARQRQFETWGIIGGPDKGRRPTSTADETKKSTTQLSNSF
ncbi:tRNA uridine(34) hydroxylase, N-terminal [Dillenia turbinata]|uniref:tRNA uridine(34) hydroxylase, N-terminal n=1 Tax=Dillenia turbinata TaxID=194707 RepID=A0AAN8VNR2_9MAGN